MVAVVVGVLLLAAPQPGPVDASLPFEPVVLSAQDEATLRTRSDALTAGADAEYSLDAIWRTRFTDELVTEYQPMTATHAYTYGGPTVDACGADKELLWANAHYCPVDQSVTYDIDWLRHLYAQVGPVAPALLLGHEWGHHVASQLGEPLLSIQRELQADCFAGMALRSLVNDGVIEAAKLDRALALAIAIGDDHAIPPRRGLWYVDDVHGTGAQRRQATAVGYAVDDTRQCRSYADWMERPPLDLDSGVRLQLPPGVNATIDRTGAISLVMPTANITIEIFEDAGLPAGSVGAANELLEDYLGNRFGGGVVTQRLPGGFVDRFGWSVGPSTRLSFEAPRNEGPASAGVAALQQGGGGLQRVLVAQSLDGSVATADDALRALAYGYCDPSAQRTDNCGAVTTVPYPSPMTRGGH